MKKIVTHTNLDMDAAACVWLIKKFLPKWKEAQVEFVTGDEAEKIVKKADKETLVVDVGYGQLDHHQTGEDVCAAKLCLDYIKRQRRGQPLKTLEEKALRKLVAVVNEDDNFLDLAWPEVGEDRYKSYAHRLLDNTTDIGFGNEKELGLGMMMLDSFFANLKNKIRAEEELKEGEVFNTPWGRGIACLTGNRDVLKEGQIKGYSVVVKKDPESGAVKIFARWDRGIDLTPVYQKVKKLDPGSDWFLHASKVLLLNQASVAPRMRPSKLNLEEIIKIFEDLRR